jgi:hypothetical protein
MSGLKRSENALKRSKNVQKMQTSGLKRSENARRKLMKE